MFSVLSRYLCISTLLLFCLGCAAHPLTTSTKQSQCADNSLGYLLSVYAKSTEELAAELKIIDSQLTTTTHYCPALKLAFIFSAPNTDYQNLGKSILLLEKILTNEELAKQDEQSILVILPFLKQSKSQQQLITDINYSIQKHIAH